MRDDLTASRVEAVDAYIVERLLGSDPVLDAAIAASSAAGLPRIEVSAALGQLLHLLARMADARRILEIGTLGGYSTICLARALPDDGRLISLELDPGHAEVASANLDRAGLSAKAEVRVGPAFDTLTAMIAAEEGGFDFVFIDADKPGNVAYLRMALALARLGATIVVDNVVRQGAVIDADNRDSSVAGTRALFDAVAAEPRLTATAIQTVGAKPWDGFLLARVADR